MLVGSKRYVKANNMYLEDYDDKKESTYIVNLDANALYATYMCEYLPYGGLAFEEYYDEDEIADKVFSTSDDRDTGYYLTIAFSIPTEIHDLEKSIHRLQKVLSQT